MRGLKPGEKIIESMNVVASFTDAWIETSTYIRVSADPGSHLLQMRGLKQFRRSKSWQTRLVASFTDAWIETKRGTTTREIGNVASFTDAWIETGQRE